APVQNSAEDIGKTLLLDTEELMKAIRGGPAGNLPLPAAAAPAASTGEAIAPMAAPASEDWSAALDGIKDWQIEATTPSFFSAPQAGRDMGTTQAFRLDQSTLTAPKAPATSFAPAVGSPALDSPVNAESSSATEFAAPDLQLPDLVHQPKARAAPAARSGPVGSIPVGSIPRGANESFHESPQERDHLREHFAHRPGRSKPIERVRVESIEHEEFRDLAIAHDDIQSARVVFEEVRQMFGGAADPIFRALVFGAIVSYCRPFQRLSQHPALAAFSTPRFRKAHQELAVAHQRLVLENDTGDDEVVRMFRDGAGEEDDGMSFAVRTSLLNEQRLPLYIALCQALEMKLLEHLQVIGEEILGPAPAREVHESGMAQDEVAPSASSVSKAELDAFVAPAMYLSQPVKTMTTP
ncbi:MAG: hypothetical protein ABIU95_03880, partial [Burkholderiales bacterium]